MRSFAQQPHPAQSPASFSPVRANAASPATIYQEHSIPHLQFGFVNQAGQQSPHSHDDVREVATDASERGRRGHDFGRIAVHSKSSARLQTKLTINAPGDVYEQEADRLAERVMRLPEPSVQCASCACGAKCAKCRTEQPEPQDESVQTKRVEPGDSHGVEPPPIVHEALRSTGQPLAASDAAFFGSRLGYDFTGVRVHSDARASESARALNAFAYTVGRDIVFAEGQYQPATTSGRQLIAHELAHVVQQRSASAAPRLQRRVVDDNAHLPCRATAGRSAADVTAVENAAATMAETAATAVRARPLAEATRGFLWRRFRLDYNDRLTRCRFIADIANRLERIARSIRNEDVTYRCDTAGGEPSSDCNGPFAVTHSGPFGGTRIDLCSRFWGQTPPEKAATMLHEWAHYVFSSSRGLGDERPGGFDTAECYNAFATEVSGGAVGATENAGCVPNPAALPALNATFVSQPCPENTFLNMTVTGGYAYGLPGGRHHSTLGGSLDFLIPLTLMHDWELSISPRFLRLAPTEPNQRSAYLLGVRTGLQFRRQPWRFGTQFGGYVEGGGINVPEGTTGSRTHPYLGAGVTGGVNFRLGRQNALQIFANVGGTVGFDTRNDSQFGLFEAGLNIALQFQ